MADSKLRQVTDHAVVRYMERVLGHDIDAVRRQILADGRGALIARVGTGRLTSRTLDAKLIVKGGCVVSVVRIGEAAE